MPSPRPTRRQFAATLVGAAGATLVAGCARPAAPVTPRPATPQPAAPASGPDAGVAGAATPAVSPREAPAARLVAVVAGMYGASFPTARQADVRGSVARALQLGEALRKVPVANGVDPYSVCGVPERGA
jgi:hypothetical protein